MPKLIDIFCERRGITTDYMAEINSSACDTLMDIDEAADFLRDACKSRQRLVVIPDFDMDGIMSGVVGYAGFSELCFNTALFIPNPSMGYGLSVAEADRLMREYPDTKYAVTCDVGISEYDGIARLKDYGVKILLTDHHKQIKRTKADVTVDPMRVDETYSHPEICGAYVLWKCIYHYANKYGSVFQREQIERLKVFAGIGTISDAMPVLYENRRLVRDAIAICKFIFSEGNEVTVNSLPGCNEYRRAFRGLYDVLVTFWQEGKISGSEDIDETFFGYYLAPVFNSVKRMNYDMAWAFGAFFGSDRIKCINMLLTLNENRKALVKDCMETLLNTEQPYAPFIYTGDVPLGIAGLVASKLMDMTGLPTLVLSQNNDGDFAGSGRSPEWYPFIANTKDCNGIGARGHEGAFGAFVDSDKMADVYSFLKNSVMTIFEALPDDVVGDDDYDILISTLGDGDIDIDVSAFRSFLKAVRIYKPFGRGFPSPVIAFKFRASDCVRRVFGRTRSHVSFEFGQGFVAYAWNQSDVKTDDIIVLKGNLSFDDYNGVDFVIFTGDIQEGVPLCEKE